MDIEEWEAHDYKPNYNIAPMSSSPVIIKDKVKKTKMMRWGLIPSWSKNDHLSSTMINARLETILEKPSFSSLVHHHRCVVLVDGYYEWTKQHSQPYYITQAQNKILPLAGLWTKWENSNSDTIFSYTIITKTPIKSIKHLHNRMPFILNKNNMSKWIDCNQFSFSDCLSEIQLENLNMKYYPVSKFVNSVKNNSKLCTKKANIAQTMNIF